MIPAGSQKKATPKELLFLCPMDSNRSVGMGSVLEGSGLVFGDRGAEPLPAGSKNGQMAP